MHRFKARCLVSVRSSLHLAFGSAGKTTPNNCYAGLNESMKLADGEL
jgi:hypothetical protein